MSRPHRGVGEALRRGDRNAAVTDIRASLTALGHLDGADADLSTGRHVAFDVFDEELDHAVRAFQQHRGLLVDGIVGEATNRALREASYRLVRAPCTISSVRRCTATTSPRYKPAAGSRFLHRPGRRIFRLADPQRVDVIPTRVRPLRRRHLRPGNVALLVLSQFAGDRRLAARHSRRGTGCADRARSCRASGSSSIRAAAAPTTA